MARLEQQNGWRKFLDDNFDILQKSLHLTDEVIEHLRRESVISEPECQTLIGKFSEAEKLVRARELLNILRTDVAGVRFRELVAVLQIRAYRCLSAAKLFRDFAKNQYGLDTEGWIPEGEDSDDGSSSTLFVKPSQMPIDTNVKYIGSFNFDASLPASHLSRPNEINKVRTKLNDAACNGNIARPKIAIVSGIGGIGKSTLARLFALHLQSKIEVDNVIWIPAATFEAIVSTFARLALTEFQIESYSEDKKTPLPPERFLPQLYRRLFQGRTLLIFDNAEGLSEEELHQFIPSSITPGQQWRPLLIVTSRPNNWKLLSNNVLDLGYLDEEDGADYVMNRLGHYCPNKPEAQKLVQFYGNLIIALEASTAAIMETNRERENGTRTKLCTVSDHLKEVEERQVQLQTSSARGFLAAVKRIFRKPKHSTIELGPEYKKLESLWSMSFEKVESEKAGRLALEVLDLCSCLDVDEIPVRLLELIWSPTKTQLLAAIQLLKEYSLITSFEESGRSHLMRLRLHRVLQKIRWNSLKSPEAIINIVKQVLAAADCFPSRFTIFTDPDALSMYRCLNQLVPTLEVFVKSEAVLQYLADVIEELLYRFPFFNISTVKNSRTNTYGRLLKLKYEYLEVLVASSKSSIPDDVDFLEIVQKVSALTNLNSAEETEKQVLLAKLQLLCYRILANQNSPTRIVPADFCRLSQFLCEQPRTPANYWATYECGKHLISHYMKELEFQNAYVIWNDLKKHGIGKQTDPVTSLYFNLAQKAIMLMYLFEGKLDEALETLDDEINARQLDHVNLRHEKTMLARLHACVGDYDASLQLYLQADQIDTKNDIKIDHTKPCFLTFAGGITDAKYFQQVTNEFMEKCSLAERQKYRQSYMDCNSLDLVRQILAPETDDNLRKRIRNKNTFSSARQCFVESATNEHMHELLVLYNKSKEFYRNGDLSSAKTSLKAGLATAAERFGKYAQVTHAFRYKLGIVLRDQWISTGDSGLLQEALEIVISLVATFSVSGKEGGISSPLNTFVHKCCHALGTVLFYTSDFNLAVQVFFTVWSHRRVIRGEDHKRAFESKLWYGRTLNKLGRRAEAVAILEEIVRDVRRDSRKTDEIFQVAQDLLSSLKV